MYGYNYGYGNPYMYGGSTAQLIGGGIMVSVIIFLFLYCILAWIFRSIGLYHLAKNRGISHAWFAWVPILSQYILGRLINNKVVLGEDIVIGHASFFLPFLDLLGSTAFSGVEDSWIAAVFTICVWVYNISALWRLFKIYRPKKRVSYTIWSAILTSGFFIFAIRDDKPFDELEPNKVYENYYSGKEAIDREYYRDRAEIRAQEKEEKDKLREEYRSQLDQANLTNSEKEVIRDNYYEERQAISKQADELVKAESQEYQQDIKNLEDDTKEDIEPIVAQEAQDKDLNSIDSIIIESTPQESGVSVSEIEEDITTVPISEIELQATPIEDLDSEETEANLDDTINAINEITNNKLNKD